MKTRQTVMKKIYTFRGPDEQRSHLWSKRRIEDEIAACPRRSIERYFLDHLPKDKPILEAGCGLGAWVVYLGDMGYDIAGIDNDASVIRRLKAFRPALRVEVGDIRRLPYADGALGAVISLGVMEHFEEGCDDAMGEALRVLKPGGLFFFTVPMNNLFRRGFAHPVRSLYLMWRKRLGEAAHFAEYRFSRAESEALLRKNGFAPMITTWDDFCEKTMSLGIWADCPPLHAEGLYVLNPAGKVLAFAMNSISRWIACSGVLCVARKAVGRPGS